jgi:hypothetical protein
MMLIQCYQPPTRQLVAKINDKRTFTDIASSLVRTIGMGTFY